MRFTFTPSVVGRRVLCAFIRMARIVRGSVGGVPASITIRLFSFFIFFFKHIFLTLFLGGKTSFRIPVIEIHCLSCIYCTFAMCNIVICAAQIKNT